MKEVPNFLTIAHAKGELSEQLDCGDTYFSNFAKLKKAVDFLVPISLKTPLSFVDIR